MGDSLGIFDEEHHIFFSGMGVSGDVLPDREDGLGGVFGGEGGSSVGGVADGMAGWQGDDDDDDEMDLPMHLLAILLSGEKKATEWVRDNGRAWEAKLYRSDAYYHKRMRMSPASFEELFKRVLPFLRVAGDGIVGRPPQIEPHIRLLVVLFWLGHGGSQFTTCEVADIAESTFSPILRETVDALLRALPSSAFPETEAGQAAVAQGFVRNLECRIQRVAGVIDGCLIPTSTPPAKYKAAFNTRRCFYGVNLLAIVDSKKRFLWTRGGLRGSMSDSRAFRESAWYEAQ